MNWKDKAIAATCGTQLGAILHCAFGREQPEPRFVGKAIVTSDGFVQCDFVDRSGQYRPSAFVGSMDDLQRKLGRLAAHLDLTGSEPKELIDAVYGWVGTDYRSQKGKRA